MHSPDNYPLSAYVSAFKNKSFPSRSLRISIGNRKMNKVWVQPSQRHGVFKVFVSTGFQNKAKN